jgi:hypothetical protein
MLFNRDNINASLLCFRKQISSSQELPFKKVSTIDNLYSATFFNKEIGAVKALANTELVNGHFTIPHAIEVFKNKGCDIDLEQLKEIIFNTLFPVFNDVEPSTIGFSHCNKMEEGFYWLQHFSSHKSGDEITETGHLGLMHTCGFSEVHNLAGHTQEYPIFDLETAKLYCDLYNNSMNLDLDDLPNFDHQMARVEINKSGFASIFKSKQIKYELSKLISLKFDNFFSNEYFDLFDESTQDLTYIEYLTALLDYVEIDDFANDVEEIISKSLWEIKIKYYLLGNSFFTDSATLEPFCNSMILKLTIPRRAAYLDEKLGSKNSILEFVQAVTSDCIEDVEQNMYPN